MSSSKVVKAGIGYMVGNYLLKGLSFLTIPIFARILTTEDYGIVNTFGAYESIIFVIIGLAIHTSFKNARYKYKLTSEGADRGNDYRTYVSNSLLLIWISGVIWLIIVSILYKTISRLLKLDSTLVVLLVLYSMCNAVVVAYNSDISINYEYKKYLTIAGVNFIGNILISLGLIFFIWPQQGDLCRIIGIVSPIVSIGVYLTVMQFRRSKPKNFWPMMKWGIRYSLPIIPHGISQIILSSFDRIMITHMVSNAATGIYSFAYNVFAILQVTANSIDTVWTPWFYEKRKKNDLVSIKLASSIYALFLLVFSTIVILISPELVMILGGPAYKDSVYCVIPIVCAGYFTFLYNIPAAVEYYHERTGYIAVATTCAAIINIVANYIFIEQYGYIAAAYTTLGTYFLYYLFHYFMAKKIEGMSLFSGRVIILSIFLISIGGIFSAVFINVIWIRFLLAALVGVVFLLWIRMKVR